MPHPDPSALYSSLFSALPQRASPLAFHLDLIRPPQGIAVFTVLQHPSRTFFFRAKTCLFIKNIIQGVQNSTCKQGFLYSISVATIQSVFMLYIITRLSSTVK